MMTDNININLGEKIRIGIFGGSFNPVHNGHISLCIQCSEMFNFDKVLLVPANIPPHKSSDELLSNKDRFEMLKLAVNDYPLFEVSDIEYKMSGTSYTYRTIMRLRKLYPNAEFYFIVGTDMLEIFDKWYKHRELLDEITLVVGAREKDASNYQKLLSIKHDRYADTDKIQIVNINAVELSSTQIRNMIKHGESIKGLLDKDVAEYILRHNLYK